MTDAFPPAVRPTMYFIGVTTRQSSINAVFPRWASRLGLGDCELRGMDFPVRADPARFRAAVEFIKRDPLSLGALVTTHKIDVFNAAQDCFDEIDPLTRSLGEISSIFKRGGRLHGRAVDPWTGRYALSSFLTPEQWDGAAEALILGAGGAGTALAWTLSQPQAGDKRPARLHVADRVSARLEHLRALHVTWSGAAPLVCHHISDTHEADALIAGLPARSLVVNATGVGKDIPGSPVTDAVRFPARGRVWEFNYRGDLVFLRQARAQQAAHALHVEDGWVYFLHGWTRVMADVFDADIPTSGPLFEELGRIAAATR